MSVQQAETNDLVQGLMGKGIFPGSVLVEIAEAAESGAVCHNMRPDWRQRPVFSGRLVGFQLRHKVRLLAIYNTELSPLSFKIVAANPLSKPERGG